MKKLLYFPKYTLCAPRNAVIWLYGYAKSRAFRYLRQGHSADLSGGLEHRPLCGGCHRGDSIHASLSRGLSIHRWEACAMTRANRSKRGESPQFDPVRRGEKGEKPIRLRLSTRTSTHELEKRKWSFIESANLMAVGPCLTQARRPTKRAEQGSFPVTSRKSLFPESFRNCEHIGDPICPCARAPIDCPRTIPAVTP